jgi:DNA-binding CsgD family transcriptional regulator
MTRVVTNKRDFNRALGATIRFVQTKSEFSECLLETDVEKIIGRARFLEQLLPDVVVVVCGRNSVRYVSANCKQLIGYGASEFRGLSLEQALDTIHADDLKGFRSCIEKIANVQNTNYGVYRFFIYYRMKGPTGKFLHIEDQKIAVETTPGKFAFITLLKNVSGQMSFNGVKLVTQKRINGSYRTIDSFVPAFRYQGSLTSRQMEVFNLISEGLSNKAIADRLNVSVCTIKNHKQVMFRKSNARNSIELINALKVERA